MFTSCGTCVYGFTYLHEHCNCLDGDYSVCLLRVDNYACVNILVLTANPATLFRGNRRVHSHEPRTFCRTVRRVALAGKVKDSRSGAEGKPSLNRATVSRSRPETG